LLLTITTTHKEAQKIGYLLGKHPDKLQIFEVPGGKAHVFYPESLPERCTVALLLDLDPVTLSRPETHNKNDFALQPYVNDRPYIASSWMCTAIAEVFSSAMNGRCRDYPELPNTIWPFEATLACVQVRGGIPLLERIFAPLGFEIEAIQHPLDEKYPEWGEGRYYTLTLRINCRLQDLLSQLYVLIPVLDNDKHYFIGKEEGEKLLSKGGDWLEKHPEREYIVRRYMKNQANLAKDVLLTFSTEEADEAVEAPELVAEKTQKFRLHDLRLQTACERLLASGATSVLDLGCGEGRLLQLLLPHKQFTRICGTDVSPRTLEICKKRLRWQHLSEADQKRLHLFQSSVTYRDRRFSGFDAAVLVEVIEHLELNRLPSLERSVFEFARPRTVVITTPRADYNAKFEDLEEGKFRHSDHRFEWTEKEFQAWGEAVAARFGYSVLFEGVGELDATFGRASQMAIFSIDVKN
jgi:3' terminal RNA ribose 2'-O-methyltransferase Hen1